MEDLFDIANLITTVGVDAIKIKPEPGLPEKSSNEILSELFSTFDADEGIVSPEDSDARQKEDTNIKSEKPDKLKKRKSKKKHKHKDKKHRKKSKRNSSNSNSDAENNGIKRKKKHKRKYKHKHDSASTGSSDSDEPKSKVRRLDADSLSNSVVENDHDDGFDILGRSSALTNVENLDKQSVVKKKPGCENERTVQTRDKADVDSPKLPPITKKIEDDSEEAMLPKLLLDKGKQPTQGRILIKDLKNSVVYNEVVKEVECKKREKAARMEDGESSDSSMDNRTPTLSPTPPRHDDRGSPTLCSVLDRLRKQTPSPTGASLPTRNDLRLVLKEKEKKRLVENNKSKSKGEKDRKDRGYKEHSHKESRDRESKYARNSRSRERKRSDSQTRSNSHRSRSGGREKRSDRSKERRERNRSSDRWERERSRERRKYTREDKDRHRSRSEDKNRDKYAKGRNRSRERKERIEIDKKKLLEIARRNAINMIKQGTLPLAQQDKAIAVIQAGEKTVDELTDFCKSLSKSEALGELSSISSDEDGSSSEKGFHHPFVVKERPNSIIMNIRDAKQLPTKTFQEKTAESSNQLRLQFPVSSGQHHRKTENEWVPVSPKKSEPKKTFIQASASNELLALMPAPTPVLQSAPPPQPAVFAQGPKPMENVDIGSIVSQRLAAMRKLRENPNDVQALNEMYRAQNEMKSWAESKQMPGQFTGSTGAKVLSAAELTAGYQAWARKDQLVSAQPVSGGMGMALLQKMGWKPGEGLGKNKEGTLEPLQLEVKLDKRGLISEQDIGKKVGRAAKPIVPTIKTLEGKHPVSLLGEYCSKRKYGVPVYELCFECGPDHKKNFLFKVKVNDIEYKPSVASPNKKQAKAEAAQICLQSLGLLPS